MTRWYKRDGAAFIQGTMGLTLEEKGAYSLCLDLIYSNGGPIADDARWLSGVCGTTLRRWAVIRASLLAHGKLYPEDGLLMNARAKSEIAALNTRQQSAGDNGMKGGPKRAENSARQQRDRDDTVVRLPSSDGENEITSNDNSDLDEADKTRPDDSREDLIIQEEHPTLCVGARWGKSANVFQRPDWVPVAPWDGFVDMRKASRKAMTDRAKRLIVAKLQSLRAKGEDIAEVLNQSTLASWSNVYPVKTEESCGRKSASNFASTLSRAVRERAATAGLTGGLTDEFEDIRQEDYPQLRLAHQTG